MYVAKFNRDSIFWIVTIFEKRWSESVKKAKIKNSKVYKGRVASMFGLLNKIVSIRKNRRTQNNDSKDI